MNKSTWPAPAKLNLFLHITGRRPDGMHELQTLFQLLDWGDKLLIRPVGDGRITRQGGWQGVPVEEDLAIRAAQLLKQATGSESGAEITVRKNIPAGSGLGGGSSDAATILVALNQLWNCGLCKDELAELGLQLGADVPLFVRGRTAWAEGIGERLFPYELGDRHHYVLVFPGIAVSTAEIFGDWRPDLDQPKVSRREFEWEMGVNECEQVVLNRHPELRGIKHDLQKFGRPRLTGTGSCIFLRTGSKNVAEVIKSELKSRYNVRAVRGVDHSPLLAKSCGGS